MKYMIRKINKERKRISPRLRSAFSVTKKGHLKKHCPERKNKPKDLKQAL